MLFPIFEQALIALPLLIGAYLTLSLLKLPDFSLESAYLSGAIAAFLCQGLPFPLLFLSAALGGMCVGGSVCVLTQGAKLPFLLAAIVINGLCHGLSHYFLKSAVVSFHPRLPCSEIFLELGTAGILIFLVGIGLRSQLGYGLAIYGNNPNFFRNHGICGEYVVSAGVLAGHSCAGISSLLFAISSGFIDLTMQFGMILFCLTGLLLGKALFRKKAPSILVPVIGAILYFTLQHSLLHLGINLKYFQAFQALLILSVLLVKHRKQSKQIDHLGV